VGSPQLGGVANSGVCQLRGFYGQLGGTANSVFFPTRGYCQLGCVMLCPTREYCQLGGVPTRRRSKIFELSEFRDRFISIYNIGISGVGISGGTRWSNYIKLTRPEPLEIL
jgi:hypothetical protein